MELKNKYSKEIAEHFADELRFRYNKHFCVCKEYDGTHSIVGINHAISLYRHLNIVSCTDPNYNQKFIDGRRQQSSKV